MRITIRETKTGKDFPAEILPAKAIYIPLNIDDWNFDWLKLSRIQNTDFYKLILRKDRNYKVFY